MKTCKRGHTEGRYKDGKCRGCHRLHARRHAKAKRSLSWHQYLVPSAPLRSQLMLALDHTEVDFKKAAGIRRQYGMRYNLVPRQVERDIQAILKKDAVTINVADRWATFFGLHIDLLYSPEELRLPEDVGV